MAIVIKQIQDHIAILRLNDGPMNAISSQLVEELSQSLVEVKGSVRALILFGGDKFFSAFRYSRIACIR